MTKELKDWSLEELQTYGTWEAMHAIAKGEPLKTVVWRIMDIALMWNRTRTEKKKGKK